jgi:AraC-like DNA-binding protein
MVEQGRHPIDVVARQIGFADPDRMRRAFLRAFRQPPQVIRRNARMEAHAWARNMLRRGNRIGESKWPSNHARRALPS